MHRYPEVTPVTSRSPARRDSSFPLLCASRMRRTSLKVVVIVDGESRRAAARPISRPGTRGQRVGKEFVGGLACGRKGVREIERPIGCLHRRLPVIVVVTISPSTTRRAGCGRLRRDAKMRRNDGVVAAHRWVMMISSSRSSFSSSVSSG